MNPADMKQPRTPTRPGYYTSNLSSGPRQTKTQGNSLTEQEQDSIKNKLKENELDDILALLEGLENKSIKDNAFLCLNTVLKIFDASPVNVDRDPYSSGMTLDQKKNFVRFVIKYEFKLGDFNEDFTYEPLGLGESRIDSDAIKKQKNTLCKAINDYKYADIKVGKQQYNKTAVNELVKAFTGIDSGSKSSCCGKPMFFGCSVEKSFACTSL
jgi:hypothetical protein